MGDVESQAGDRSSPPSGASSGFPPGPGRNGRGRAGPPAGVPGSPATTPGRSRTAACPAAGRSAGRAPLVFGEEAQSGSAAWSSSRTGLGPRSTRRTRISRASGRAQSASGCQSQSSGRWDEVSRAHSCILTRSAGPCIAECEPARAAAIPPCRVAGPRSRPLGHRHRESIRIVARGGRAGRVLVVSIGGRQGGVRTATDGRWIRWRPVTCGRGRWYVLAAGVFWSLSGVLTKSLPLDPMTIALYRGLFAGLAICPWCLPGSGCSAPS